MASNRSSRTSTPVETPATTPTEALSTLARESSRIQLAALSAAGKALTDWTDAAERLTHAIGDELLRRVDGETNSRELIVAVATATTAHIHDLATIPRAATTRFDVRLTRPSTNG